MMSPWLAGRHPGIRIGVTFACPHGRGSQRPQHRLHCERFTSGTGLDWCASTCTRQLATLAVMAVMGPTARRDLEAWAGNIVRLARAKAGVSQAQLAQLAGVPRSTVERIEAGARQPSLPTLGRLLAAVDLDLRIRLEPYDDHDDVLDANYAALTPEERRRVDARHEAMIAAVDAAAMPHR